MGKPKHIWSKRYWNGKGVARDETLPNENVQMGASDTYTERHVVHHLHEEMSHIYTDQKKVQSSINAVETHYMHYDKSLPLRPKPTYSIGRDLNMPDLEITPLRCADSYSYPTSEQIEQYQQGGPPISIPYPTPEPIEDYPPNILVLPNLQTQDHIDDCQPRSLHGTLSTLPYTLNNPVSSSQNIDALHYVTNHLSNIEITRIHAQESPSVDRLQESGNPETFCQNIPYNPPSGPVREKLQAISPKSKNNIRKKSTKARVKRG